MGSRCSAVAKIKSRSRITVSAVAQSMMLIFLALSTFDNPGLNVGLPLNDSTRTYSTTLRAHFRTRIKSSTRTGMPLKPLSKISSADLMTASLCSHPAFSNICFAFCTPLRFVAASARAKSVSPPKNSPVLASSSNSVDPRRTRAINLPTVAR